MPKGGFAKVVLGQLVTVVGIRRILLCGTKLSWVKFDQVQSSSIKFSVVRR